MFIHIQSNSHLFYQCVIFSFSLSQILQMWNLNGTNDNFDDDVKKRVFPFQYRI